MTKAQLTIVERANVEQRVVDEVRRANRLGHGIARCGQSLECWRCGQSGTVSPAAGQRTAFAGTLADSKGCGK